jgi:WD repeat and SOF domain-containing protein 1
VIDHFTTHHNKETCDKEWSVRLLLQLCPANSPCSVQKIKVLCHALEDHLPTRAGDPTPVSRNLDPLAHPFAKARERTRALNAAKMERMFAKPFLASLEGHIDGVNSVIRHPGTLSVIASASADGG